MQGEQDKKHACNHIEPGRQAREKIEPKCGRTDEERAHPTSAEPIKLISESAQCEQANVVVLHHVLRVMKMGGKKKQRQHSGNRMTSGKAQQAKEPETDQRGQEIQQDVDEVA